MGARASLRVAPGGFHDGLADSAAGGTDDVRGARVRRAFRAGRAGACDLRQRAEFGRHRSRRGALRDRPCAWAAAEMAQDRSCLSDPRGAARQQAETGGDPGKLRLSQRRAVAARAELAAGGNATGRTSGGDWSAGRSARLRVAEPATGIADRPRRRRRRSGPRRTRSPSSCHGTVARPAVPGGGRKPLRGQPGSSLPRHDGGAGAIQRASNPLPPDGPG